MPAQSAHGSSPVNVTGRIPSLEPVFRAFEARAARAGAHQGATAGTASTMRTRSNHRRVRGVIQDSFDRRGRPKAPHATVGQALLTPGYHEGSGERRQDLCERVGALRLALLHTSGDSFVAEPLPASPPVLH